jgi:CRP-like cAMP-binding protein
MEGCVSAYIDLKTGDELITDYLGVGSVIGQYTMFDQETMHYGFRSCSNNGVLLV